MSHKRFLSVMAVIFLMLWNAPGGFSCTNYLVTRGASADGSVMITYAADSHTLYGELYFWPSGEWPSGSMLDVYEWDTGRYMGKINQVPRTWRVVGNMNEHQVAIGETTFGGRRELARQSGAIMDYGSLMYIALQRSTTAREAIGVITSLVAEYGYASSGESFSIADANEVWILEMIGKGEGYKGAVWVALRVPDGYISGHANHARITTFPMNDPENCLYSPDVISFAREKGWFSGKEKEFSFSDVYAPIDFSAARFCEARVWAGFNRVSSDMGQYVDYAMGKIIYGGENNFPVNRMPLWIKPEKPVSVQDVIEMMRDQFTGTPLDMTKDPGAGPYKLPYRWRNLTWKVDGETYVNERAVATQQTGFSFVSQSRNWLPDPVGGILWFSVDDAHSTVYVPMYCGMTEAPESYRTGNGDLLNYSETSAFWAFNQVANFAYIRYEHIIPDIRKVQRELENKFTGYIPHIDKAAASLLESGNRDLALQFLTHFSVSEADATVKRWQELYRYLLVKFIDGNTKKEENGTFKRNEYGQPAMPDFPGYPEWWLRQVVNATGDHLKVPAEE